MYAQKKDVTTSEKGQIISINMAENGIQTNTLNTAINNSSTAISTAGRSPNNVAPAVTSLSAVTLSTGNTVNVASSSSTATTTSPSTSSTTTSSSATTASSATTTSSIINTTTTASSATSTASSLATATTSSLATTTTAPLATTTTASLATTTTTVPSATTTTSSAKTTTTSSAKTTTTSSAKTTTTTSLATTSLTAATSKPIAATTTTPTASTPSSQTTTIAASPIASKTISAPAVASVSSSSSSVTTPESAATLSAAATAAGTSISTATTLTTIPAATATAKSDSTTTPVSSTTASTSISSSSTASSSTASSLPAGISAPTSVAIIVPTSSSVTVAKTSTVPATTSAKTTELSTNSTSGTTAAVSIATTLGITAANVTPPLGTSEKIPVGTSSQATTVNAAGKTVTTTTKSSATPASTSTTKTAAVTPTAASTTSGAATGTITAKGATTSTGATLLSVASATGTTPTEATTSSGATTSSSGATTITAGATTITAGTTTTQAGATSAAEAETTSSPVTTVAAKAPVSSTHVGQIDITSPKDTNPPAQNPTNPKYNTSTKLSDTAPPVRPPSVPKLDLKQNETHQDVKKPAPKDVSNEAVDLDPLMKTVYLGVCAFADLPSLHKKVVRIFISSTFSDTKEERNALMEHVYPKLAEFCREKHGLEFQVVDMRWGVPEQAADNHSTTDLCLQEIRKCQQVSVGPCFVAIVGDKYGYRPIPTVIEAGLFEALCSTAPSSVPKEDWELVTEWYLKDSNAQPVVYVLQPISAKIPQVNDNNKETQTSAWSKWNDVNTRMTRSLRLTAKKALEEKKINSQQQHEFYMSVTENEITQGMFNSPDGKTDDTCMCIMRKIPDIEQHITESKAPKFIDLAKPAELDTEAQNLLQALRDGKLPTKIHSTNVTQMEIEWSASGAQISLETAEEVDIVKTAQEAIQDTSKLQKHREYLDNICSQFFQKISTLIDKGGVMESVRYTEMTSEILQHFHLARTRTEVFEGREDLIGHVKSYLESDLNVPLTIFGKSGCGKTSLMAKIVENCCTKTWMSKSGKPFVTVARFLGTTPQTSNLYQLFDTLCSQLSKMCGKKWEIPEKFKDMVTKLVELLALIGTKQTIVLMLDSIDQLMPAYNAYKMKWLPDTLPPNVKVIISTIPEGYPVLDCMKERYTKKDGQFYEVTQLGDALGLKVIKKWLTLKNRTITTQQEEVVKHALEKCSLPLYARIAYDHIRKWKSYDIPSLEVLEVTAKGAINQLFESMETKFGKPIVQHSLAYLTAARHGLSEVELEHLMSLDDVLLNQVYKFWRPPIRRVPPLLWTRIRSEVSSYIVERSADDILVLSWYHRQFIEATKERYLKDIGFAQMVHSNMVDYFLGRWGGGKPKPFTYSQHQMKRFNLSDDKCEADRKVPLQPFIIPHKNSQGQTELRFNKRKLFELPFHLYKCKQYDMLKTEIFFNFEWLFATLKGGSAMTILDEFEIFMKADKQLKKDPNMKTLYANLTLIQPYISKFPDSLSYELVGRLTKYIAHSPLMKSLVRQCDTIGVKYCPLTPMLTCFETADLGLRQNINYRAAESWHEGGAITCTKDFRTMYILDYDDGGVSRITSWDIETGEVIQEIPIKKERELDKTDIYIQMVLDAKEEHMIAFYRGKYFSSLNKDRYFGNGNVDIIRLSDGEVVHTISEFLHKEEFSNPLIYQTTSWIAIKFGPKTPMFNLQDHEKKIDLTRPHMLSQDEKHLVLSHGHKAVIREFDTKRDCGEFDHLGSVISTMIATDKSFVLTAGPDFGDLKVFDLTKKSLNPDKQYGFLIKAKHTISLPTADREKLGKLMQSAIVNSDKTQMRVQFEVSQDGDFAMVIYQNMEFWIVYLYYIFQGRRLGSYIAQLSTPQSRHLPYPKFSNDSQSAIVVTMQGVEIYCCENGTKVNEYSVDQPIMDFYVSKVSDQFALMTSKDVAILGVLKTEEEAKGKIKKGKKKQIKDVSDLVFLPRECESEKRVSHEFVISQGETEAEIQEVEGAAHLLDTDPLASARSKRRFAMDTRYSPDGLKVIQLHTKVQVVDCVSEEIKYTPKSGETITRTVIGEDGSGSNETIQIPTGTSRSEVLEMQPSDRIVNENNKIKFRISGSNQTKIMSVPSQITVYSAADGKMKKLQRFTVYMESIVELSNKYVVMQKQKVSGEYVNVYDLETGRLLATHECGAGFGAAIIPPTESVLITVDQDLLLRLFEAPQFTSCEIRIAAQKQEYKDMKWSVRDIVCAKTSSQIPERLVIHYKPSGTKFEFYYLHVDLLSKQVSEPIMLKYALDDISKDCSLGLDGQLNIYDLTQGKQVSRIPHLEKGDKMVIRTAPYANRSATMRLIARFSDDHKYIIFADRYNDSIHLIEMTDGSFKHLASVFTHAPWMDFFNGLLLRLSGQVIMIRAGQGDNTIILRIVDASKEMNLQYQGEAERALSLVPGTPGLDALIQQKQELGALRRNMLLEKMNRDAMNPIKTMTDDYFLKKFRFRRETVKELTDMVKPYIEKTMNDGLPAELQVLLALSFYATGDPDKINITEAKKFSEDSVNLAVKVVSEALVKEKDYYVPFPITKGDIQKIFDGFASIANFPRVCSIVECTHVRLSATGGYMTDRYLNPAGWHSLNVQLACDPNNRFTEVLADFIGSVKDSVIFKDSKLNRLLDDAADKYQCVLLGDSAYPCLRYLMTPIANPKVPIEEAYTKAHAKTHSVMDKTLEMWRSRFPGLIHGLCLRPEIAAIAIGATCVLHNIAIDKGEPGFKEDMSAVKQPPVASAPPDTFRGEQMRKQISQTPNLGKPGK